MSYLNDALKYATFGITRPTVQHEPPEEIRQIYNGMEGLTVQDVIDFLSNIGPTTRVLVCDSETGYDNPRIVLQREGDEYTVVIS